MFVLSAFNFWLVLSEKDMTLEKNNFSLLFFFLSDAHVFIFCFLYVVGIALFFSSFVLFFALLFLPSFYGLLYSLISFYDLSPSF